MNVNQCDQPIIVRTTPETLVFTSEDGRKRSGRKTVCSRAPRQHRTKIALTRVGVWFVKEGYALKSFRWVPLSVTFSLVLICLGACSNNHSIIPVGSTVAYTKDELIDSYWEYKDELNEVAEIVLSSESWLQFIVDNNHSGGLLSATSQAKYFSEEDWNAIVELFKEIRPIMIERRRDEVVHIPFERIRAAGDYTGVCLFYIKDIETAEKYKNFIWVDNLEHLDGYWYIDEGFSAMVRKK